MRDAALARGQRGGASEQHRARVRAGCSELIIGPLDQRGGTATMGVLDTFAQHLARLAAAVVAAQRRPQVDERARVLEPCRRVREHRYRLPQQPQPRLATLDEPKRAQRDSDRPGRAPRARELELLHGQRARLVHPVEAVSHECRLRAPRDESRVAEVQRFGQRAGAEEVDERFFHSVRGEPQSAPRVEELDAVCVLDVIERDTGD